MSAPLAGILNLDKPPGITSARAVDKVKRLLPRGIKIGHAGTLDPFATGVLLLLIGKATKLCEQLMGQPKEYITTIKLGATTATDDIESPEQPTPNVAQPPPPVIQEALQHFIGPIQQRPPAYSAIKLAGRPAYELARQGKNVEIKARTVHVHSIDLLDYTWPLLQLRINCGRGTYIRSIARDLGETLNTGGYLTALRRTHIGKFTADKAAALDQLTSENVSQFLQPMEP